MRKYKERERTIKVKVCVEVTCELCGAKSDGHNYDSTKWDHNQTELHVRVKQQEGNLSYDYGYGTQYNIDICPTCFREKLVPWINEQGGNVKQEEYDW